MPNTDKPRDPEFDSTPQVSKDGVVTLSADIQAEQKAAGLAPDVQPKASAVPVPPVESGGPVQPTGNVVVQHAVAAAAGDTTDAPPKKAHA
jgi:hypothetical protein